MKYLTHLILAFAALHLLVPAVSGATQTITFVAVPARVFGEVFTINPTTDAPGLVPTLSVLNGPATVAGGIVTLTGVGSVTLRATQAGNNVFSAAAPVTQTFEVSAAPAVITLSALNQPFDDTAKRVIANTVPVLLPVTVTYNGAPTPPNRAGSYFVIATINDPNYRGIATGTLIIGAGGQSIQFGAVPIPTHVFGDVPFTVSPTASSGLPVTLHVLSGPATVDGTTVTLTGAGTVVLQATQMGSASYVFATLTQSFEVTKRATPIILTGLAQVFNGSVRSVLAATVPIGLEVHLTYNGSTVAPTAAGSYEVIATITDDNYRGLATGILTVADGASTSRAAQAVSFGSAPIPNHSFGDQPFSVSPTASSGLPVVVSVASGPAQVDGTTVTLTGAGLVTLLASQAGDAHFAPTSVTQVFEVAKALAKVEVIGLVQTFDGSYRLTTATNPAGLLVIVTYNGSTVPPSGLGRYVIVAMVNAANYEGVTGGTLQIGPNAQTIAFPEIPDHVVGDAPFDLNPVASSGLPVSLAIVSGPARVSGRRITLTGIGVVIVQATQEGNRNFEPVSVTQSFGVAPGSSVAPQITLAPFSQRMVTGGTVTFTVAGRGDPAPTYQWFFNLIAIPGATNPSLTLSDLQPGAAGAYTVTLTNVAGTTTTRAAALTVDAIGFAGGSRLVNLSARATLTSGAPALIVGFVVSDHKEILVRGIGPTLASFGVAQFLGDPMISLAGTAGVMATNDDWQSGVDGNVIASTSARVSAFALANGSKDAALMAALVRGAYTMSVSRQATATGTALAEVYDLDPTGAARFVNMSVRMNVAEGDGVLIAGFVIAGDAPKTVLLRGLGPGLAVFGVAGVLADPRIALFAGSRMIASNDDWNPSGASSELAAGFGRVGAFGLPAGSKDAALMLTLEPGAYTLQVAGAGNSTGVALAEIYDMQ